MGLGLLVVVRSAANSIAAKRQATCLFKDKGDIISTLDTIQRMFDNYNRNLASIKEDMDTLLLLTRFLQCENENADYRPNERHPMLEHKSAMLLSTSSKTTFMITSAAAGCIAILGEESNRHFMYPDKSIVEIDLDTKNIEFIDFFRQTDIVTYRKINKIEDDEVIAIPKIPFNPSQVSFNELSDFREFIEKNFGGWLDPLNKIIVPSTRLKGFLIC